ncbi:hypothetical protein ACQP10_34775 [Streptosporangium sandarakinum]|uniref:hypothetical protein n=1 Tax=Streptosporangium sandarakinum TaxID=1260955 RepID=UPI003D8B6815
MLSSNDRGAAEISRRHRSLRTFGRRLFEHAVTAARGLGFARLAIEADPNAEPFYLARGAVRTGEVPSGSVPGRLLPLLEITVA